MRVRGAILAGHAAGSVRGGSAGAGRTSPVAAPEAAGEWRETPPSSHTTSGGSVRSLKMGDREKTRCRASASSIISQSQDRSLHRPQQPTLMMVRTTTPTPRRQHPKPQPPSHSLPPPQPPSHSLPQPRRRPPSSRTSTTRTIRLPTERDISLEPEDIATDNALLKSFSKPLPCLVI